MLNELWLHHQQDSTIAAVFQLFMNDEQRPPGGQAEKRASTV
jgi:hypothetical protein